MTAALIQESSVGSTGNPALTMPSNLTAGSFLIATVAIRSTSSGVTGITDTLGNAWVKAGSFASSNNEKVETWYARNSVGGACTITASMSIIRDTVLQVSEWSGMDGYFLRTGSKDNTLGTSHLSGSVSAAQGDVVVAVLAIRNTALPVTHDVGPGFVAFADLTQVSCVFRGDYRVALGVEVDQMSWTSGVAETSSGMVSVFGIISLVSDTPMPIMGRGATW